MKLKTAKHKFLVLAIGLASVSAVTSGAQTNQWHLDTSLNLFLAGLSGNVTVKGQTANVDASFGDIMEHLQSAAAGKVTLSYDRWLLATEFSYMRLTASVPAASATFEQWLVEPSVGYQFCDYCEGFVGTRYNNINGHVNFNGPLGVVASGTQQWWDPIIGTQLGYPLIANKLSVNGHFDIGGFGVGSDLTWQAYPYLNWQMTKWASMQVGYRMLATDYQTGTGLSRFRYDVIAQGPQVGFTVHF